MSRTSRSTALAAALALAATGIAVAVSAPAQARPTCTYSFDMTHSAGHIYVESHSSCADEDDPMGGLIRLEKWGASGKVLVAVGYYSLDYTCPGNYPKAFEAGNGWPATSGWLIFDCG
ncbi:hypothetical protein R8Z50_18685 [Longispora sp. K20-0274]|uniref:hypothetical protein n=1 Tax=Longispora sp. K20-0274 TaxID=3088255 RepID=UPI00399C42B5